MRVGAASLNQIPFDWKNNSKNIVDAITKAKKSNVELLCLPELCITGYGCEDTFLSEWIYEKSTQVLNNLLPLTENICISIGLPVRFKAHNYNCACLISNGKILGITAKQHLANDGVHYEPRWFTPWEAGRIETININGQNVPFGDLIYEVNTYRVAFEICEDAWRNDQRPAIQHHHMGIDIILNPSASHFAFEKTKTRVQLIEKSAKEFNCTYIYANLLGNEAGRMIYDGELLIATNNGLKQRDQLLSFHSTKLITYKLNSKEINIAPFLSKEEEFQHATSLALFDYLKKSKAKGYCLSLSGGADSTTCAVMVFLMAKRALEELGIKKLTETLPFLKGRTSTPQELTQQLLICAYQGTNNSSDNTLNSAKQLAQAIGAQFHSWLIDDEVSSYSSKIESVLKRSLSWENDDIALQNIQARSRSPIIWMLTNITGTLLLTTSNRSEGSVGYTTMDGDTSGSLAPIAAVDKSFIRKWLIWAEKELDLPALSFVNELAPTAELRPSNKTQTDENDLMPYNTLLEIEQLAVGQHLSPVEVFNSIRSNYSDISSLKSHIHRFYTLWSRNQWKRERIAPAFHLDDYNVDPRTWCRFPILSSSFEEELEALKKLA